MSQDSKKHSFLADEGTPLEAVMNYIKSTQGKTLKGEIEDWASMMHYPHALYQSGASFEKVVIQAIESIRRLNQEITAMTTLINMMAIAEGKESPMLSHLSPSAMTQASEVAKSEKDGGSIVADESEIASAPQRLSKYVNDPF